MPTKKRQSIRRSDSLNKWFLKFTDALSIVIGLQLMIEILPDTNSKSTIIIGLICIGLFNLIADVVGVYRSWRGIAFEKEAACTLISWMITFVALSALGKFSVYSSELAAKSLFVWFLIAPVISLNFRILSRAIIRFLLDRGINTRNFAVVGVNQLGFELIGNIQSAPDLGLKLLGFYDDRPDERLTDIPNDVASKLGRFSDLIEHAKNGNVEVIFITLPMRAESRIRHLTQELNDTTASVYIVPDLFVFQMLNSRWTDIQGIPVVGISENPFYGVDGVLKRIVDFSLAFAGLLVAAIPMLLISLAVKLSSKGPILFIQKRYGLDGKQIPVWKFRSMTTTENGDTVVQATKNDKRVTKVGAFLRKTSLDELPQLFNVLMGHMSLVGPRPHANAHNEYYRKQIEGYMLRHKVKPGITGLAQVNGCRGETETLEKMENRINFDHQYIREWTIWLDLKIMFKTLLVVFKQENAY